MELFEKTVEKNYVYEGRIINVRCDKAELHNGNPCTREVVEHNGGVSVAALTENDELIFVRQFRYPYMEVVLELPAGKLEKGEDPFEAGKRELEEETGYKAEKLISYGQMYPTCGYSNEIIYLYVAEDICKTNRHLDEDEFIDVEFVELEKVVEMINKGVIKDAKTICLISKYLLAKQI